MKEINTVELKHSIDQASSIVLTVHVHPDGDALGAMLGFYEALRNQGKKVWMVVDDEIPAKYNFLSHIDMIYKPETIPTFDEPIDMLLVLDASTLERIGKVGALYSAPIFNIDHHISNSKFADYLYLKPDFAATGEIVTDLCIQWGWPITASMANALYMAIATDCGFFKFSNTTAHTLEMGANCVAAGANPQVVSEAVEVTTQERIEVMKEALQTVEFYRHGTIAMLSLSEKLMNILADDTDGFVELIRNVDTVDVAVLLKAKGQTMTRISLRSKQTDVNAVANIFGGGGHIRAAGCSIEGDIDYAKESLLKELLVCMG